MSRWEELKGERKDGENEEVTSRKGLHVTKIKAKGMFELKICVCDKMCMIETE